MDFEVLRGLTNALLAAKKPDQAVKILLASRESLQKEKSNQGNVGGDACLTDTESQLDPIQTGAISAVLSLCMINFSSNPDDFRGYLAKGIILIIGDVERMFIQALLFAPEGAKAIVDRYSRQ